MKGRHDSGDADRSLQVGGARAGPARSAAADRIQRELDRHQAAQRALQPLADSAIARGDDAGFYAVCLKTVEIAEKIRGFEADLNGGVHPDAHLDILTRLKKQFAEAEREKRGQPNGTGGETGLGEER